MMRAIAAMLVLTALAGCASDEGGDVATPKTPDDGTAAPGISSKTTSKVEDGDDETDPAGNGTLTGRVRDPVNFSIEGAAVAVLGTNLFQFTNDSGIFHFEDAPAGTYMIRVSPPTDYESIEGEVEIEEDATTEVTVVVPYSDPDDPNHAHIHDNWKGKDTYRLMDAEVDFRDGTLQREAYATAYYPNYSNTTNDYLRIPVPPSEPGHPSLILPGTAKLSVTLDWDEEDITASELGLRYVTAGSSEAVYRSVKPPGSTWHIPVDRDNWDVAHQARTMWEFGIFTAGTVMGAQDGETPGAVIIRGPMQVTMTLTRGTEPPVDPPHPDHWDGKERLVYEVERGAPGNILLGDEFIVPPETKTMEIRHEWSYGGTYGPTGDLRDTHWEIRWLTPEASETDGVDEAETYGPEPCGERCDIYTIEMESGMTDAPYQKRTAWQFFIEPPDTVDQKDVDDWVDLSYTTTAGYEGVITITRDR